VSPFDPAGPTITVPRLAIRTKYPNTFAIAGPSVSGRRGLGIYCRGAGCVAPVIAFIAVEAKLRPYGPILRVFSITMRVESVFGDKQILKVETQNSIHRSRDAGRSAFVDRSFRQREKSLA